MFVQLYSPVRNLGRDIFFPLFISCATEYTSFKRLIMSLEQVIILFVQDKKLFKRLISIIWTSYNMYEV